MSGHGALGSNGEDDVVMSSGMTEVDIDSLRALLIDLWTGLSLLSDGVAGVVAADLKSKVVPGVLGVLVADPKDAKAPEPRPNAEEPPVVGEASAPGVKGGMALNGFLPPCDESPPNRLDAENVR